MFASPAESFSSSSASLQDYGIPAAEVSFDSIPAELPIHYNFYGAVASPAADAPSDLDSPAAAGAQGAVGKNKGGRAKRRRDPNRPKGWISAILMYSNAHRARVQLERPDATFGEIARVLSAEYRALAPEDRAVWEQAHEDDKARYEREMLSYVPPPQISPSDGDESASGAEGAVQAKKPRKKRDPNAPKRNLSSWQLFSGGDARKKVIADLPPGASLKEIMSVLSQKYKALTPEERAPLDRMAAADKERYQREKAAYEGGMRAYQH